MSHTRHMHATLILLSHCTHTQITPYTRHTRPTHAARKLNTCHSAWHTHTHTFMHAQAYYMHERHKLVAHTLHARTMYARTTQATLKLPRSQCTRECPICITHPSARTLHSYQTQTHCVHVACHTQTTYIARTVIACTVHTPTLHACALYPHMQAACSCLFTACRTYTYTSHAGTH